MGLMMNTEIACQRANALLAGFIAKENDVNLLSVNEIASTHKILSSKEESVAFLKRAGIWSWMIDAALL